MHGLTIEIHSSKTEIMNTLVIVEAVHRYIYFQISDQFSGNSYNISVSQQILNLMSGKESPQLKKYLEEYDTQTQKTLSSDIFDEESKNYFRCLASSFFKAEINEEKLNEYLTEMVEDQKQRNILFSTIKRLKVKHFQEPKPKDVGSEPTKKVKKSPAPKVEKPEKAQKKEVQGVEQKVGEEEGGNEMLDKKEGLKKQLEKEGKQKCRFFPFCKNEETCQYFHPSEKVRQLELPSKHQCTYFPHCKHGDNCLYIHESCKYKEKCQRPDCPFAHPFKRNSNPLEALLKGMMSSSNPFKNKKKGFRPQQHKQSADDNGNN